MVNLLFITNSTKIEAIRTALQPFLKVKIDIVSDFDYGLKDVFEKRPATVFIQDQIAGVTGESVARHIQMLLGASAPSFIFMHEGSTKANPIKGLFDYLIDLSQADATIVADIQATLKSLLGVPQWEKIYIPPKLNTAVLGDAVAVPDGNRAFADKLVDDFLSNLDNSGPETAEIKFHTADLSDLSKPADEPFHVVSSPHDQLAEMVSETSKVLRPVEAAAAVTASDVSKKNPSIPVHMPEISPLNQKSVSKKHKDTAESVAPSAVVLPESAKKVSAPSKSTELPSFNSTEGISAPRPVPQTPPIQQTSPADFFIGGERPSDDVVSDDLLRVFEANYYSQSGGWKRYVPIAAVLIVCVGGCVWYLLNQDSHLLTFQSKPAPQSLATAPLTRPAEPAALVQRPVSPPIQKDETSALPTFIPLAGLDSSYAKLKPGWERYVDTTMEYRVFRSAGKIKALQVLGIKDHSISEPRLKSILIELLGDSEYRVNSREKKLGYDILRASVGQNAELLIYRNKSTLRAFVVSLD